MVNSLVKAMYERSESCNLLTLPEAAAEFNLSPSTIEKLSKQCDAKLKIGRSARYKRNVLQEHINSFKAV